MNMFPLLIAVVCRCIVYQQTMTCCEFHTILFLNQVCRVSVLPFLSYMYMNRFISIALVVGIIYKQTIGCCCCIKFYVCSFLVITCSSTLHEHASSVVHCSFVWCIHKCIAYQQIMITLSQHCWNIAVNVIRLYPCTKCGQC